MTLLILYTALAPAIIALGRNMMRPGQSGYRNSDFQPLKPQDYGNHNH